MRNHSLYNERLASRIEILISKESSWELGQRACGDDEPRQGRKAVCVSRVIYEDNSIYHVLFQAVIQADGRYEVTSTLQPGMEMF